MIPTDPNFWDCECDCDYIHPKSEDSCPRCDSYREEMPDSRISELKEHKLIQ